MVKEINNSVALILLLINLFASIGIIISSLYYPDSPFYIKDDDNDDYFNTSNIILKINLNKNFSKIEENLQNYSFYNNFEEEQYDLKNTTSSDSSDDLNYATYINFITLYMCIFIIFSFFIEENDCPICNCEYDFRILCFHCECNCETCKRNSCFVYCCLPCFICYYCGNSCKVSTGRCCYECQGECGICWDENCNIRNCHARTNEEELGLCFLYILYFFFIVIVGSFVVFFYLFYYLPKKWGKTSIRYVSFFINFVVNIIVFYLAYSVIDEKENSIYVILGLSGLIFISNLIGIILTNIYEKYTWCDSNYIPPDKRPKSPNDFDYEPSH